MKKVWKVLFGNENPLIAVSFFSLIYVAIYFFIGFAFKVQDAPSWNPTLLTIGAPTSLIYELEKIVWLQVVGFIAGIALLVGYVVKNGGLGNGEGDKTPGYVFAIGAFLVIVGFFPAIFKQNHTKYTKYVDEKTYQYYKANPDKVNELFTK